MVWLVVAGKQDHSTPSNMVELGFGRLNTVNRCYEARSRSDLKKKDMRFNLHGLSANFVITYNVILPLGHLPPTSELWFRAAGAVLAAGGLGSGDWPAE
ncbi:hypothetical protein EVAR_23776_1 [Eumeta japonica]|uniref:Uncharacterized protein n=1 Tax=Eumeta variegata TaxID=151549 RepID=A0A4C1VFT3_EUMVA|nr:hypothetical protein EVAR_23776_1 [Eumeta japonica]